jgi:lipopolysaccharide transport system ATP-binding protein
MYVRLAFAVAAHLSTEILLVDEVLAVGDIEFQEKCLGKIKDVANTGRTVIFVSHHMQSVSVLCKKAMFLERGKMVYFGEVPVAIDHYVRSFGKKLTAASDCRRRPGTGQLRFVSVEPSKEFFESGEEKRVNFTIQRFSPDFEGKYFISCVVVNAL